MRMGAWGTAIFSDDLAQDVRREYNILLSIGKDNEEIEKMLINYYSSILNCNDSDEDVFWFALALCEWKKGRLSSFVKAKALDALKNGYNLERWNTVGNEKNYEKRRKVLNDLHDVILSPMPPIKKIKKPTVHHCPWEVGSLLAYRIVSNKLSLKNHPCFMKYVLLRVVKIEKKPISRLFDTEYYDESMLVGLYNWIGSAIPDTKIVSSLKYISINDYTPLKSTETIAMSLLNELPEESREVVRKAIASHFDRKVEKCVWLDWLSTKNEKGDITCLDCDENFQDHIPEFFQPSLYSNTLTHFLPFDITLSKKFEPYLDNGNFDYVLI